MQIAILRELSPGESRVALVPEAVRGLVSKGLEVAVEAGCGAAAGAGDEDYRQAGASVVSDRQRLLATADLLPVVNSPAAADLRQLKSGAVIIGFLRPLDAAASLQPAIERGATLFAMELVPRITRAQAMDALSSMATVAGYKAVLLAADRLPRMFPLLMTAAGTIPPAHVLVLGAGVAGLQAIATARRLGAMVNAYDVRAAAGEQVRSLGAKFLEVDLGGIETEDKGGYAKELTEEALARGRELIAATARTSDVVITTAQVPGKRAPRMLSRAAVESMRPGSVVVDLAAPAGGNCELTRMGEEVVHNGVTVMGPANLPATVPVHASQLYSRNVSNFLQLLVRNYTPANATAAFARDPVSALNLDWNDEIIRDSCVAHQGELVNKRVSLQAA
ncbi:MAG: Re/Si-specific NAD(P)(+) transhydrogenase subunit alpha [Candidatus Korobacteraceae bacterium]